MKITEQAARELADAHALSETLDRVLCGTGFGWGVISVALATVMAESVHASADNPATRRRIINDVHALARQLLVQKSNRSMSEDVRGIMMNLLTADSSRPWAVDPGEQKGLVDKIMEVAAGSHRILLAGAAETILVNLVCDRAFSIEAADRGLAAVLGDMRQVVIERFASNRHAAADAQGTA